MVTNSLPDRHRDLPATWQQELAEAITDPQELLAALSDALVRLGEGAHERALGVGSQRVALVAS